MRTPPTYDLTVSQDPSDFEVVSVGVLSLCGSIGVVAAVPFTTWLAARRPHNAKGEL